jgi:hypothetical protein
MNQRDLDVDILKALSRVEGAIEGNGNSDLKQVMIDELDWIVDFLSARIKENKYDKEE